MNISNNCRNILSKAFQYQSKKSNYTVQNRWKETNYLLKWVTAQQPLSEMYS